jgi:hypothetical protein
MLWYNELCLGCLVFCVTPWLVAKNCLMIIDIIGFESEATFKTTFVRLIGSHTTLFLVLAYCGVVCFNAGIDAVTLGSVHLCLLGYLPFIVYLINRAMEE